MYSYFYLFYLCSDNKYRLLTDTYKSVACKIR